MRKNCPICYMVELSVPHSHRKLVQLMCIACNKPFLSTPHFAKKRETCSKVCGNRIKSIRRKGRYTGKDHPHWNGGKYTNKSGYVELSLKGTRAYEHRHVMQVHLGRKLSMREHVHHIDGNKSNNSLSNLVVINIVDHAKLHASTTSRKRQQLGRKP